MDASQWPQDMGLLQVKPMIMADQFASPAAKPQAVERERSRPRPRPRPPPSKEQTLHCPRCKSTNTKFCYYNNYSLTQPRYFCKACKRYWTEGGSLRNVPVGGGSRKNKNKTVTAAAAGGGSSKAQKLMFPELNTNWQESSSNNSYNLSAMDLLKSSDYAGTGFGGLMQEFMLPPVVSFPPDSAAGNSEFMFPLEEQNKGEDGGDPASGYWNGMLMGGGSW